MFLKNYFIGLQWKEYDDTPSYVTRFMMQEVLDNYNNKDAVNGISTGILNAANKIFSSIKS
jgi:hypothetical protein